MIKRFVIVVYSIRHKELIHPKVIIKECIISKNQTIDDVCECYYEWAVNKYDLCGSDKVFVYMENN